MTAKAKAQALVDEVFTTYDRERPWEERLVEAIAGALEAGRNEALEEAAQQADDARGYVEHQRERASANGDDQWEYGARCARGIATDIAKAIRALASSPAPADPVGQS